MKYFTSLFVLVASLLFLNCNSSSEAETLDLKGMTKVSIMYNNGEDAKFDMDYYRTKHMPMLKNLYGDNLAHYTIDQGLSGRTPADQLPYLAIGHLYFKSLEDYQKGFEEFGEQILSDIPNYTNIRPTLLISEVIK